MDETWWRKPEQLDEDQRRIVSLDIDGDYLVIGPPGSGKTNLLLLRASFLVRSGYANIAVITFTRVLREFLATGAENYPFEPERIQTFRSWGADLLRAHGEAVPKGSFNEMRAGMIQSLGALIEKVGDQAKFDCLLIDEVQDYQVDEIEIMRKLADRLFVVGDNNQRIYEASGAIDKLEDYCGPPMELKFHYRNGMAICRLADGIMNTAHGGMLGTCNYDEAHYPSTVTRHKDKTLEGQVEIAIPQLQTQLAAYPDEWIGVLAPQRDDVAAIYDQLSRSPLGSSVQLQKFEDGYEPLDTRRPIVVMTMHASKGLEYRAAHLLAQDNLFRNDNHQKLAYTAVTRAKTSLSIYHDGALPGYLERGLLAVNGSPMETPSLADLFPGASS